MTEEEEEEEKQGTVQKETDESPSTEHALHVIRDERRVPKTGLVCRHSISATIAAGQDKAQKLVNFAHRPWTPR